MKFKFLEAYSQEQILKMFYLCGSIIFIIVAVANTYTNFVNWENMMLSMKVSSLFMNIFNYVLAVFFFMLLNNMNKNSSISPKVLDSEDLDRIFKEVEKSQKK